MGIVNIVTNGVKDVVAVSQSVTTAVKEEVEMYFEAKRDVVEDAASDARETIENSSLYARFEDLEEKVKATIEANFSKLNFTKTDDFEKIEKRIDSLEDKLSKLLENLEAIRKTETKATKAKKQILLGMELY